MSTIPNDAGHMPVMVLSGEPEVADRDGHVVVRYLDTLIAMKPEFANKLADKLMRVSYKCYTGSYPDKLSNMALERRRATLVLKVERMVEAAMRDRVEPKVQAARIVDTVMQDLT